jgi:hypothetical protein
MASPTLEVYLYKTYPFLTNRLPEIDIEYRYSDGAGTIRLGNSRLGSLNDDVKKISDRLVEKLKDINYKEDTRINFKNCSEDCISVINEKLEEPKYKGIISYLRTQYPQISFETQ